MPEIPYSRSSGSAGSTMDGLLQAVADLISVMRANAGTSLPGSDFTEEQRAMAMLPLPFRNMIRDPFIPEIAQTAKTTAYPAAFLSEMAAKACSSFRFINPNQCALIFRGATSATDLIKPGEGRLMMPGQTEVFSTQNPKFLSIMPVALPGLPIPTELVPPQLNYGIGS